MANARLGRYTVRIYDVSCEDLVAKDKSGKSDPYCKFDFDKYRKFNTEVKKRNLNPTFSVDETFNYATQYADRLQFKHLAVDVQDKDFWGKDFIGSCKVDLHTLVTGPVLHNLELLNKGQPSGRIKFKVEMTQIYHFKVFFKSATVTGIPNINGKEPSSSLRFRTDVPEHKLNVESSIKREENNPEWNRMEQLRFNTNLRELMNTTLRIELLHNGDVIGCAKMPFRSVRYKGDGIDMPLKIPIEMNDGTQGVLFDAMIYYKDFPRTAQMIGGEHNDNGIFDAQYFHSYAERPRFVKVHGLESKAEIKTRSSRFNAGAAAAATVGATAAGAGAAYVTGNVVGRTANSSTVGTVRAAPASAPPIPASRPPMPVSRPPATRPQLPATAPPTAAPRVVGSIVQPVAGAGAVAAGAVVGAAVVGGRSHQPRTIQTVTPVTVRPVQPASAPVRVTGTVTAISRTVPTQRSMPSYLAKLHPSDRERTVRMGLPAPWSCHLSANGRPYYVNHQTKTTQWTLPQSGIRATVPSNGAIQGTVIQPAHIPVQHARTVQPQVVQPVVQPALVHSYGQPRPTVSPYQQQFASMRVSPPMRQRLPPVNPQQLGSIQAMGFDKELAQEALARNANDVQRAIMWLSTSPIKLSMAWDLRVDKKSSRLYYANREGKFTQWDRPIITQQQEPMLKSLLSMGFPRRLAVEALAHYKGDAQAATNWILYNNPQPLPTSFAMLIENGRMVYLNKQNNQRYSTRPIKPTF